MQKQSLARRLGRWVPLIGWMLFISFASSNDFSAANTSRIIGPLVLWFFPNTSAETLNLIHICVRKLAHLTEYAILGILAARAFRTSIQQILRTRWFQISLCVVVVYALLDEYHQSFVPSRTSSILDSLIDAIGGLAALLVIRFRTRGKHSSNSFMSAYNHCDPNNLSNE
jgi:Predicted integral membrane protein